VGDSLSVRALAATLVACADPDLNRQETAFLAAVGEARRWRITRDTLLLGDEAQPVARFVAVDLR
jgi:heat shock protein HslJ